MNNGGFMNMKFVFLTIVLMSSFACFASQPAKVMVKPVEREIRKKIKHETEIEISFFVSRKKNAEQVGTLSCTFNHKKNQGTIDLIDVYKGFRNLGYGTGWFKKAIITLAAFNPKSICWQAQPLDNYFSRKDLEGLLRLYTRLGGKVTKKHINPKENHVDMEYPMALAHALTILHPIFATQEKSPILPKQKQEDPFALIVAYANMDLKNTDLKPEDS